MRRFQGVGLRASVVAGIRRRPCGARRVIRSGDHEDGRRQDSVPEMGRSARSSGGLCARSRCDRPAGRRSGRRAHSSRRAVNQTAAIPGRTRELVRYFLRLGLLGFGGPVALVGQMERELVTERGWLTKEQMREAIAVCQSLPGPLAIQVGIYISYLRGGFWGAWAGGWSFILPNFVIVAALGALYVHLGDLQLLTAIFYGVSPAVIALILHSCYRLAKLGMEDWLQWVIAVVCLAVTVILQAEVALLCVGSVLAGILYYGSLFKRTPPALSVTVAPVLAQLAPTASSSILGKLLLFFLKAGSLTFGSGLVIVPFLEQ